ncbi:MAG: DUF6285 domain-containing protein [Pseudomonadota bacterium]
MPQDGPDVRELLRTVGEFLHEISDQLPTQERYYALCCTYMLQVVEREIEGWEPVPTTADAAIATLLGEQLDAHEALAALSDAIKRGDFEHRFDELMAVVLAHVEAKVNVSKPSVLTPNN